MRSTSRRTIRRILVVLAVATLISGATAKADFVYGQPRNLGPLINSGQDVMGLCISSDGLSLYFYADRPGGYGAQDLWVTTRETTDSDWGPPENLGPEVNSSRGIEMPSISTDGLTLYFNDYADSPLPGGYGLIDIWMVTRLTVDDLWSAPINVGTPVNSSARDAHACISVDNLSLYFVSQREGNMDIWVSRRPTVQDDWGIPANIGPVVNTGDVELYPTISSDERVLFFNHNPLSNSNLYMAWRPHKDAAWEYVKEVEPPINGDGVNFDASISSDGRTLYFSSTRTGNYGFVDGWEAPIRPVVDFNGDGQVDDKDLRVMADHWGADDSHCDIGPMPWGDGAVDIEDLRVFMKHMDGTDPIVNPLPGAVEVSRDVILNWTPLVFGESFDVYFGTSFDDVSTADRGNPRDVLASEGQTACAYDPEGLLGFGRTFYWRIDEIGPPPESAVYRGFVWSFTTEPFAYPVENIIVRSNTISTEDQGPEKVVDGSGLNEDDQHSTEISDMWVGTPSPDDTPYVQFEFDRVYKLYEMLVWNYNMDFETFLGLGVKDATVEYSEDGDDWNVLGDVELAQGPGTNTYACNTTVGFDGVVAKYVRLTIHSSWNPSATMHGLSEVRFMYIPAHASAPQPEDGETGVHLEVTLRWHGGREVLSHEVCFSTDRQAVLDGTALVDTVTESSYQPESLDRGRTYYWKINEVDADRVWEGGIWQFSTVE